jgi:choline-sulfatase
MLEITWNGCAKMQIIDSKAISPNIVFILTDDQGAWAMGCAGNSEIQTPNLDRLAASGIRFDNFFCTSPVCSPARASIITGKIPSQHGVQDFIKRGPETNALDFLEGQLMYTDILADNGYICGLSGKWHLGSRGSIPKSFSHWYAHASGSGPYYKAPMLRDGQLIYEENYITDVITDDAITFIEANADGPSPFYLSVHYTAPHDPWTEGQHPQELVDLYKDCPFSSCPQEKVHPEAVYQYDQASIQQCLQGYFAAVTGVDANIGRLLDKLEELGILANTLVIFMSDNGFNCGHHGIWGKGNGTFSLNMFDTSVKVPAIISHSGQIPEGIVCDELLSQYDVMPTLLDYLGLTNPDASQLPGESFVPLLQGQQLNNRKNVVVYDEYGPVRMIRSKEWKYIHRYPYGPHELYDLVNDAGETMNVYELESYNPIVLSMRYELEQWFETFVNPAIDGTKQPVRGNGQIHLSGTYSKGKQSFDQNRKVVRTPEPPYINEKL